MKVISLGWGTQSFGLAAMSALGILPKVDVAIHADTTHERSSTYEFAKKWTPWLEEHGVRVETVRAENTDLVARNMVTIPARTSETGGMFSRHCTADWKIYPIRRWLQANRNKEPVELWIGITLDEVQRVKPSNVKYITHRWPFLEPELFNDHMMRRSDVKNWLRENGIDVPSRSACYFCPFHHDREWRDLRDNGNRDWKRAVETDAWLRKQRPPFDLFLHRALVPLDQVDFSTPEEHGQMSLWENECEGMCGV